MTFKQKGGWPSDGFRCVCLCEREKEDKQRENGGKTDAQTKHTRPEEKYFSKSQMKESAGDSLFSQIAKISRKLAVLGPSGLVKSKVTPCFAVDAGAMWVRR